MATVCVLQLLLGLWDRQAAEAVRCRITFKYAMALDLDDPGCGKDPGLGTGGVPAQTDRAAVVASSFLVGQAVQQV
ncbi:transposase [Streptomyces canus]|uniref:transposase n=1 Tax=Streptomyces canus TaxID=58343 RepID=UPI003711DC25